MPDGSSSDAPVISPGPRMWTKPQDSAPADLVDPAATGYRGSRRRLMASPLGHGCRRRFLRDRADTGGGGPDGIRALLVPGRALRVSRPRWHRGIARYCLRVFDAARPELVSGFVPRALRPKPALIHARLLDGIARHRLERGFRPLEQHGGQFDEISIDAQPAHRICRIEGSGSSPGSNVSGSSTSAKSRGSAGLDDIEQQQNDENNDHEADPSTQVVHAQPLLMALC